jgi:hypothetical protein
MRTDRQRDGQTDGYIWRNQQSPFSVFRTSPETENVGQTVASFKVAVSYILGQTRTPTDRSQPGERTSFNLLKPSGNFTYHQV